MKKDLNDIQWNNDHLLPDHIEHSDLHIPGFLQKLHTITTGVVCFILGPANSRSPGHPVFWSKIRFQGALEFESFIVLIYVCTRMSKNYRLTFHIPARTKDNLGCLRYNGILQFTMLQYIRERLQFNTVASLSTGHTKSTGTKKHDHYNIETTRNEESCRTWRSRYVSDIKCAARARAFDVALNAKIYTFFTIHVYGGRGPESLFNILPQ